MPEGLTLRVLDVADRDQRLPVTLAQAKAHARIEGNGEDAYVQRLIRAATGLAEEYTRRSIAVQTLEVSYSAVYDSVRLARPEHIRLVSAYRVGDDGDALQQEGYDFRTRRDGGRLTVLPAQRMSTGVSSGPDGLRCELVVGYGRLLSGKTDLDAPSSYECAAPPQVAHAIMVTVAELYEHRAESVVGTVVGRLPRSAETMLSTFRVLD